MSFKLLFQMVPPLPSIVSAIIVDLFLFVIAFICFFNFHFFCSTLCAVSLCGVVSCRIRLLLKFEKQELTGYFLKGEEGSYPNKRLCLK